MTGEIWALIGIVVAGVLSPVGLLVGHLFSRIATVEEKASKRISEIEEKMQERDLQNHHLWLWARSLVDYGYRWRRENSPDLPTLEDTITREREKRT